MPGASATCIVLVVDTQEITLAADGVAARSDGTRARVCKVYTAGASAITAMGVISNPVIGFDLVGMAVAAMEETGDLRLGLSKIQHRAEPALQRELEYERVAHPLLYARRLGNPIARVIVAGAVSGKPLAIIQGWWVGADGRVHSEQPEEVRPLPRARVRTFCSATTRDNQAPRSFAGFTRAEVARALLEWEIAAQPEDASLIGPPISLLRIQAGNQPEWLQPGACSASAGAR
jgi:hypothetical protein